MLIDESKLKKLVVLIDDLDRCLPETAIETLEAIRLFVFARNTAFVVAADEAMIHYSVRRHFPDLPQSSGPVTYAQNYLEKLIQIPFRIPALGSNETQMYITLLLVEAKLGPENGTFQKLLKEARGIMVKPWLGKVLDATAIQNILTQKQKTSPKSSPSEGKFIESSRKEQWEPKANQTLHQRRPPAQRNCGRAGLRKRNQTSAPRKDHACGEVPFHILRRTDENRSTSTRRETTGDRRIGGWGTRETRCQARAWTKAGMAKGRMDRRMVKNPTNA